MCCSLCSSFWWTTPKASLPNPTLVSCTCHVVSAGCFCLPLLQLSVPALCEVSGLANDRPKCLLSFPHICSISCKVRGNPLFEYTLSLGNQQKFVVLVLVLLQILPQCLRHHHCAACPISNGRHPSLSRAGRTRCTSTSQPGILPQAFIEIQGSRNWQGCKDGAAMDREGPGSSILWQLTHVAPCPRTASLQCCRGGADRQMLWERVSAWPSCLRQSFVPP